MTQHLRTPLVAVAIALGFGRATAQGVSVRAVSATELQVATLRDRQTMLANRDLTAGLTLATRPNIYLQAGLRLTVAHAPAVGGTIVCSESGRVSPWQGWARTGPLNGTHAVRVRYSAARPTRARLVVSYTGTWTPNARHGGVVTVGSYGALGSPGAPDRPASRSFDVMIGPGGLAVTITTGGSATSRGLREAFSATWMLALSPLPCAVKAYGAACGAGLQASASQSFTPFLHVVLEDSSQPPAGWVFAGAQQLSVQIPGTDCRLYTEPLLLLPVALDANGRAVLDLPLPGGQTLRFNLQGMTLGQTAAGVVLHLTNGLAVACP